MPISHVGFAMRCESYDDYVEAVRGQKQSEGFI